MSSNSKLPWVLLTAGWGGTVAIAGGFLAYLWFDSENII